MKTTAKRRSRGFTLVELLVVIAIIAILAGAGFAAGNAAIEKARKVTAQAAAVALEQAITSFYAEYGSMPVTAGGDSDTQVETGQGAGTELLRTLLGQDDTRNPRAIKFLTAKEGKGNKGGLIYRDNNVTGLFDPWGNAYIVELDTSYDERLQFQTKDGKSNTLNGRRVAVHSPGVKRGEKVTSTKIIKTW